jgi:hypothetical protein
MAASGNYSASNFGNGKWGAVSCAAGNNVAWLQCTTFDTCKITSTNSDGMWVDASYWGVQGWEVSTNTTTDGACFHFGPAGGSTVHHVIFANNVANGCMGGGFNAYDSSKSASVDYVVYIGNIAYNAAGGTGACYSGLNVYQPIASDTASGTHMYAAGNFSYSNVDGDPCSDGLVTDGEGINFDTFDFSQGGGTAYTQQSVIENNISVNNGGGGILMENNKTGATQAPTFFKNNTVYGNNTDMKQSFCSGNGDIELQSSLNVTITGNIGMTQSSTACANDPIYAISLSNDGATDVVNSNWLYSEAGNSDFLYNSGSLALGSNTTGTNPAFANPAIPSAPSCSGTANVPACMATLIADYTPTDSAAASYGYQKPSTTGVVDSLFPQWLCNVNLPAGLVTKGCQ